MDRSLCKLQHALSAYALNGRDAVIESSLPKNDHGDDHLKVKIGEKSYSARFISERRYNHDVFIPLTDEVLTEQMRFASFLSRNGIPFMRQVPTAEGRDFGKLTWEGTRYRFLLFEWMEGRHITRCTGQVAHTFGVMVRQWHTLAADYDSPLPRVSHRDGSLKFVAMLEQASNTADSGCRGRLSAYLADARKRIEHAFQSSREYIMQSDLNPLNILWDDRGKIVGIIDCEHIGYTERVEGLAWLIKWYSRTEGLSSHEVSAELAASLLSGYGAEDCLRREDWERLPSLLWLTGCLNWGFVRKTLHLLNQSSQASMRRELDAHLAKYWERGEKLSALISD